MSTIQRSCALDADHALPEREGNAEGERERRGGARRDARRAPPVRRDRRAGGGGASSSAGVPLGRGHGGPGCLLLGRLQLEPAGYGVLELTHPPAERAAHLGDPLRPEDEEQDDEEDEELGDADEAGHVGVLSSRMTSPGRGGGHAPVTSLG